ncbi:uncharacterized MFS-type transporter C09D4.1-like [Pollicipes pollicipes]|uniref:uncharacterized MFS-type transporter C09D4.1-like n=1 Tax=Pollicipes pollicipes TaxID=41117 RepID=UPI0018853C25|nr:uncharacterized MFS-type transporter C09D4.1-like [Pollicipes pollicipes]
MAPYFWLLDKYGVRPAILTMAGTMALGTAVRCVSSEQGVFTATAFIGAILNGIAGIMAMAAPPHISALWFPPEQRTTATGLPNIANQLGGSCAFLIGPLIVRQPGGADPAADLDAARSDIMILMYVEAGITAALFLAALAAAAPTASFWSGLRQATKAPDLPWVVAVYSISQGIQAAYFGVLNINVGQIGVTQDQAGWLGFWTGISCCLSALVVARLTDIFRGHMKATIIGLLTCAAACFVWQLALIAEWLPFSLSMLYCSTLLSISFTYSTSPLLLEYAAELSYPVSTDVIGAIMSFCYDSVAVLYLLLFLIKPLSENTLWLNYVLVLSCTVPAILMFKTKEVYRRTNTDLGHISTDAATGTEQQVGKDGDLSGPQSDAQKSTENGRIESSGRTHAADTIDRAAALRTYRRRWYILLVYSALSFSQCAIWNTFGPITKAAQAAFPKWNNTIISMLGDMACLAFAVFMAPYCWLLDKYGVRPAILTMAGAMTLGTAVRCVSSEQGVFTATAFTAAILNGIAGIMAMAVPPHISALWFPTEQRTTATGLSSIANRLGGSGAFLIGPLIVRQPDGVNTDATRDDVMTLMYVEAGFLAALFLAALAYYPSRPPLPPSASAAAPTASFWSGLRQAAKAPDLPWVVAVYSLSLGVPAAYFGVLDINVGQIGVTQDEAGWLGFWAGISSSLSALVVARLTDMFRGHMKATIIGLLTCAAACFVWQLALIAEWLPFSLSMLYCSTLLSISFAYSTSPLLLEYAAELSYPVSTDVIGAIISFCFNLVSALYLVLFLIKPLSENTVWLNYILVFSCAMPVVLMIKTKEVYRRTNTDMGLENTQSVTPTEQQARPDRSASQETKLTNRQNECYVNDIIET